MYYTYVKGKSLYERFSELTLFFDRSNEDVLYQLGTVKF